MAVRPINMIRLLSNLAWRGGTRFLLATAVLWLFPSATFGATFTAALDRQLNDRKYILPGLGDFGDRLYGTF